MTLGAFSGYFIAEQLDWPFPFTFVVAFLVSGLLGYLSWKGIFAPLYKRGATLIHLMIASMALGLIIRHTIGEVWGFAPLTFSVIWPSFDVGPVRMNLVWVLLIVSAILISIAMHLVLTRTKLGKTIRATSSNPKLAQSSGINTGKVIPIWFLVVI
jgi:branched-subunit amino acid ABC-type transport system permease component